MFRARPEHSAISAPSRLALRRHCASVPEPLPWRADRDSNGAVAALQVLRRPFDDHIVADGDARIAHSRAAKW